MVSTPTPPPAPDPVATANAQSASNKATAITQYGLAATNQNTPQGSLSYKQIGTWDDGTPRFESNTTYSPTEQSIYDTGATTRQNLGDIGATQSAKIGKLLDTPFSVDAARDNKISQIQQGFLDPQWQRQSDALDSQLINKGIRPGSAQWTTAHSDFSNQRQKAYDQSYLDSYKTAESSALTERNQPINEITALMSGSQVSNPTYGSTPTPGVAPTDVIGAQQQSLNQQNVGYQGQLAQNAGFLSAIGGLGGSAAALGGWKFSDIETKENIDVVGERSDGLHVIDYNYKPEMGIEGRHRGFVAQEVAQVYPKAVARTTAGPLAVNYNRVPGGGLFALGGA